MSEYTVNVPQTFRAGWGVSVMPIWDGADEDPANERVVEIVVEVVRLEADRAEMIGGVPCVAMEGGGYVPLENFEDVPDLTQDDTHDLRTRWFATEDEAQAHAKSVRETWDHPNAWTSFVQL